MKIIPSTNTLTKNLNPLATSDGFKMTFHRAPNVEYFLQSFSIPTITVNETPVVRPQRDAYFPGDKLSYEPLTVTMLISEDMDNFKEIYDWLEKSVTTNNSSDMYDDITAHILTSKNNPNKKIIFHNAFPTSLGNINFSVQEADIVYGTVDATFRYDYFTFE
jgi:hypothetical protein